MNNISRVLKRWVQNGNLDEETDDEPPFDISAFDPEALALLDELLGEQIEMR